MLEGIANRNGINGQEKVKNKNSLYGLAIEKSYVCVYYTTPHNISVNMESCARSFRGCRSMSVIKTVDKGQLYYRNNDKELAT